MKMRWEEPSIELQTFVPDEYVSACWKVACAVDAANQYESAHNNSAQEHTLDHCGTASNQWIRDNGSSMSMVEIKTDGLGELGCKLWGDSNYKTEKEYSTVKENEKIFWTTSASDGRVWHHQGVTIAADSSHPNRS